MSGAKNGGPLIADRRTEIVLGALALTVGSYLIWDAYDGRGKARPWVLHLLPGL